MPGDLAKFDTAWDEAEDLVGLAVLKHLCGAVERLKKLIALLIAFGSPYQRRTNGSVSEIRSTPRLSLRGRTSLNVL